MIQLSDGQCGLCVHFGEEHPSEPQLVQIRTRHEAPEEYVDDCGVDANHQRHLRVSAISGCDLFEPAPER